MKYSVYERVGKSVVLVGNKAQKELTDAFYGCEKVEKRFWFCDLFKTFLKTVNLQQLKGIESSKLGI